MPQKQNYQAILENQLKEICEMQERPSLLLHACCAPCSSYVLEYLNEYFDITLYFYNPNISPENEYIYRAEELKRLISEMPLKNKVELIIEEYLPKEFEDIAKGKENEAERGSRCTDCYTLRLKKAFEYAAKNKYDYFSTTLSISPHKDAQRINTIGRALAEDSKTKWLFSDFKKKGGYIRSIELSARYNLYRQNYCGCKYSK